MKLKLQLPDDDDAFEGGDVDSSDSNVDSGSEDDESRSTRHRSVKERRLTRGLSRGASIDPDALDAAGETPGASDDASDDEVEVEPDQEGSLDQDLVATPANDEPEPVELGSDVDPINSGAVTPGLVPVVQTPTEKARSQFAPRRKETKVGALLGSGGGGKLTEQVAGHQGPDLHRDRRRDPARGRPARRGQD